MIKENKFKIRFLRRAIRPTITLIREIMKAILLHGMHHLELIKGCRYSRNVRTESLYKFVSLMSKLIRARVEITTVGSTPFLTATQITGHVTNPNVRHPRAVLHPGDGHPSSAVKPGILFSRRRIMDGSVVGM